MGMGMINEYRFVYRIFGAYLSLSGVPQVLSSSIMAEVIPTVLDLSDTYGCMLAGCFLSCMVWGVSCLQTFIYFASYEKDHRLKKLLVIVLWVFDTVNQIIVLKSLWPVLISNYGSAAQLARIIPELTHHAWIAQLLECAVQLYFTYRIYIFSGKKWLFPLSMVVLSMFQLFVLIPYDVIVFEHYELANHKAIALLITFRAVTAAEDILLTATLIYLLTRKGLPEFQRTKQMTIRLIFVTANTGFWTALVVLVELILVVVAPDKLWYTVVEFPICSLYFSSLLASLNTREYVKGDGSWNEITSSTVGNSMSGASGGADALYLSPMKFSKQSNPAIESATHVRTLDIEEGSFHAK